MLTSDNVLPTWSYHLIWLLGNAAELAVALIILRREGYRLTLPALRERINWHWITNYGLTWPLVIQAALSGG